MKLADFKRHDRPAEERIEALIDRFNRTARDYPRDRTVHAMFSECAARHAETMAVHDGTRGLTYAELERASNRFARVLLERHVRPESFVAVLLDNGNSFITAILGIFKAGAAYYPIEPDAPAHRTRHLMTDARCEVLVTETAQAAAAARLQAECPWLTTVIFIGTGPDLSPVPEGVVAFNIGTRDLPAEAALAERAGPTRLAYVMYTSGTSGRPKGVMVNHRGILRLVINTTLGVAGLIDVTGEELRGTVSGGFFRGQQAGETHVEPHAGALVAHVVDQARFHAFQPVSARQ